jgi:hypothetical protein
MMGAGVFAPISQIAEPGEPVSPHFVMAGAAATSRAACSHIRRSNSWPSAFILAKPKADTASVASAPARTAAVVMCERPYLGRNPAFREAGPRRGGDHR